MSFSIELELQRFPKVVPLKDGTKATLRPLRRDDEKEFHGLFLSIPEHGTDVHQTSRRGN